MGVDEIAMSNVSLSFETVKGTFKALDQISFSLKSINRIRKNR